MGIYFGTDGLRGVYGETISPEIAFKVGNSLGRLCESNKKVVIGRDTRRSGSLLTTTFSSGIMCQGVDVVDVGVVPTPVVAYLAKEGNYDFGIVISASHNDANNNGIKVFDNQGFKINEQTENTIERKLLYSSEVEHEKVGRYFFKPKLVKKYKEKILSLFGDLRGLKIVLDLANGASYRIAKEVFAYLGAKVIVLNNHHSGLDINKNCGALWPDVVCQAVKKYGADMGFSFDGDADRIIACNEKGELLDGDDILYALAKIYPKEKYLVGTIMTNSGLENALKKKGIDLIRADVGDKYVVELMKNKGIKLGGEPSGHIINLDFSTTGDGVLTALSIAGLVKSESKSLSKICDLKHFPQVLTNVEVIDKFRTLNSNLLNSQVLKIRKTFGTNGRVLVRASGTENKIRIMCEHKNQKEAEKYALMLEKTIKSIE